MRKHEVVAVVAFLVIGASIGIVVSDLPSADDQPSGEATPTETPTGGEQTETSTEEKQNTAVTEESNINRELVLKHINTLKEKGSFITLQEYGISAGNETLSPTRIYSHSDFSGVIQHRSQQIKTEAGIVEDRITSGNTTYARVTLTQNTSNQTEPRYYVSEQPYTRGEVPPVSVNTTSGAVYILSESVDYQFKSTQTESGTTVYVFSAEGRDSYQNLNESGYILSNNAATGHKLQNLTATVSVQENGIIRETNWKMTTTKGNETYTFQYSFNLQSVGETPLSLPEWTSEAKKRDANNSTSTP